MGIGVGKDDRSGTEMGPSWDRGGHALAEQRRLLEFMGHKLGRFACFYEGRGGS